MPNTATVPTTDPALEAALRASGVSFQPPAASSPAPSLSAASPTGGALIPPAASGVPPSDPHLEDALKAAGIGFEAPRPAPTPGAQMHVSNDGANWLAVPDAQWQQANPAPNGDASPLTGGPSPSLAGGLPTAPPSPAYGATQFGTDSASLAMKGVESARIAYETSPTKQTESDYRGALSQAVQTIDAQGYLKPGHPAVWREWVDSLDKSGWGGLPPPPDQALPSAPPASLAPPDPALTPRERASAYAQASEAFNQKWAGTRVLPPDTMAHQAYQNDLLHLRDMGEAAGEGNGVFLQDLLKRARAVGYDVDPKPTTAPPSNAPPPAQGNYFTNTVLPDLKAVGQGLGGQLQTLASAALGIIGSPFDEEGQDAASAQGASVTSPQAMIQGAAQGPITHAGLTALGALALGNGAEGAAGGLQQAGQELKQGVSQHPVQAAAEVAPFLLDGLGRGVGAVRAARGLGKTLDTMDLTPRVPPELVGPKPTVRIVNGQPEIVKPFVPASVSAGSVATIDSAAPPALQNPPLHPTAPGENNAARAVDGKFTPAPPETPEQVSTPPPVPSRAPAPAVAAPEAVPAQTQTAVPVQTGTLASVSSNMAGSVNLDRLNVSPEAKTQIAAAAQDAGLNAKTPTTRADIGAKARAMNLTVDDLKDVEPGKYPVATDDLPALGRAVRQLNAHWGQAAARADAAYSADPTPANLKSATAANEALRVTTLHNDALGTSLGQGLSERAETVDPFTAAEQTVRKGLTALNAPSPKIVSPKSPGFGQANVFFTPADFDGALKGLKDVAGRANSGLDPVIAKHLLTIGGYVFEGGVKQFTGWMGAVRAHAANAGYAKPLSDADLRGVYRQIKAEAQRRAQLLLSPKERVREQLLKVVSPAQVPALTRDLARVKLNKAGQPDPAALGDVLSRYSEQGYAENAKTALQSGLLSGLSTLGKIGISHILYAAAENLKRPIAAAVSGGRVQGLSLGADARALGKGLTTGVRQSGTILRGGMPSLQLQGLDPLHEPGAPIRGEYNGGVPFIGDVTGLNRIPGVRKAANAVVRAPLRVHAAVYHIPITAFLDRGVTEGATLLARREAKAHGLTSGELGRYVKTRVADLRSHPTPEVLEHAQAFAKEQMFINDNKAYETVRDIGNKHPGAKIGMSLVAPFSHVPANVSGKALEYTAGSVYAPARALAAKLMRQPLTDAQKGILANTFGRGVLGAGVVAGGYALAKHHLLHAPDPEHGEYGSLDVPKGVPIYGGRKIQVGNIGPITTPALVGAKGQELRQKTQGGQPVGFGDWRDLAMIPLDDQPLVGGVSQASDILHGKVRDVNRGLGGLLGMASPALLSQIAAAQDKVQRKKSAPLDYLKNRVPGLRETLPVKTDAFGAPVAETNRLLDPLGSVPITPSMTPAARLMQQKLGDRMPQGDMTPAQAAKSELKRGLLSRIGQGQDVRPDLRRAVAAGKLTALEARQLLKVGQQPGDVQKFDRMGLDDALEVYEAGSGGERSRWKVPLLRKLHSAADRHAVTPEQIQKARDLGAVGVRPTAR